MLMSYISNPSLKHCGEVGKALIGKFNFLRDVEGGMYYMIHVIMYRITLFQNMKACSYMYVIFLTAFLEMVYLLSLQER